MSRLFQKYTTPLLIVVPLLLLVPGVAFAELDGVQKMLWWLVTKVFGNMAGFAGMLLDFSVNEFVIGFGRLYTQGGIGASIDLIWVNVRDIFNITFIFGLVYLGFKMILDSSDSGTKRWLIHLILAAILVNFSLLFTKFVIEISNTVATQIANSAFVLDEEGKPSVSSTFMDNMGVTSALKKDPIETTENGGAYGYIFGSMIVFIVSIFVFGAGAMLLLIRFAVLLFYMVLSPFMFIGWVFPQLQKYTSEYWSGFLGRAFFAPIYLLLLYLAAQILTNFFGTNVADNGASDFGKMLSGSGEAVKSSFGGTLPPFIIACVFLIMSIVVANKLGAHGASASLSAGKKMSSWARQKTQRGAGHLARGTVKAATYLPAKGAGYATRHASNKLGDFSNKKLDQWQKAGGARAAIAGNVLVSDVVSDAATTLKTTKFGMADTVDEVKKKKSTIVSRVSTDKDIKAGHSAQTELDSGNIARDGSVWDQSDNEGKGGWKQRKDLTPEDVKKLLEQAAAKGRQAENDLSQKELETMLTNDKATFDKVIGNVNVGTFDKMMDSDSLTPDQKADMSNKRKDAIRNIIEENKVVLTENLQNMSIKQIETMGDDFIRENAHHFTQSQMDDIKKSTKFTESQKGNYSTTRKKSQIDIALDPAKRDQLFGHNSKTKTGSYTEKPKKASEIASLPYEVFMQSEHAIQQIDRGVLEEIINKKTMNAQQRSSLKEAMKNTIGVNEDALNYMDSPQGVRHWG